MMTMNRVWGRLIFAFQEIHRRRYLRKIPKFIEKGEYTIEPVGSRMTCMPPPLFTDQDWLVEVKDDQALHEWSLYLDNCYAKDTKYQGVVASIAALEENGYKFASYKLKIDNVIITWNAEFARRWRIAHKICKESNFLKKQERITCFELCRAGRHDTEGNVSLVI